MNELGRTDLPPDGAAIPLLPLRNGVLFPGTGITLPLGRERSVALANSLRPGAIIAVVAQRDPRQNDPCAADLYPIGTYARVHRVRRNSAEDVRIVLEGLERFKLAAIVATEPFWMSEGSPLEDSGATSKEALMLAEALREHVQELAGDAGGTIAQAVTADDGPGPLADRIAAGLGLATDKEVEVLSTLDVAERLRLVARLLAEAKAMTEVKKRIESDVRQQLGKGQREALLREQLKAIQRELGADGPGDELGNLRSRLDAAALPDEVRKVADRELRKLETAGPNQLEGSIIRNYLEWIADLPWSKKAEASDDLEAVARKLDADHFGLEEVKKRILEHMAVLKLSGQQRGTILCLAGPPGVGKTSLGQSIADASGRPFVRISLGGVRDEAEIRGHRRTYVGALPGRIVHALKKAGVKNPVILLDEIDKLGNGWQGSPEAALLEVLDPEQNRTFTDHYLELAFDLSEVLFICTANNLDTLSPPLRDRLEIIELSGYTPDEKIHIARRHLIPKQLHDHGLPDGVLEITDAALQAIVRDHTREPGVRQLNRQITKLCRALALEVARASDSKPANAHVDVEDLGKYLGKAKFFSEVAERTAQAGVAIGLAWTPVGGEILFVETSRMLGKGRIEITGQLGDVMKESARAALSYVRSHADTLGVEPGFLDANDLHIHVPAGAVPKDGPSAGVTMFTALTSLLTGRKVRSDTAMTGECTLRGRVLPVGGIKAKVLAAHRAGLSRVILPERNRRDLDDVPEDVQASLEFVFAEDMSEVLDAALESEDHADELAVLPDEQHSGAVVRAA